MNSADLAPRPSSVRDPLRRRQGSWNADPRLAQVASSSPPASQVTMCAMAEDIVFTHRCASRPHQRFTSSSATFGGSELNADPGPGKESSAEAELDEKCPDHEDPNQFRFRRRTKPANVRIFVVDKAAVFVYRHASPPHQRHTFSSARLGKRTPPLDEEKEATTSSASCRKLTEGEDPNQFRFWRRVRGRFSSGQTQAFVQSGTPGVGCGRVVSEVELASVVARSKNARSGSSCQAASSEVVPVSQVEPSIAGEEGKQESRLSLLDKVEAAKLMKPGHGDSPSCLAGDEPKVLACAASEGLLSSAGTACAAAAVPGPSAGEERSDPSQAASTKATESGGFNLSMFIKPGQWKCDVCLVKNDSEAQKCAACETQRPGSASASRASSGSTSLPHRAPNDVLGSNPLLAAPPSSSSFTFGAQPAGANGDSSSSTSGAFKFGASSAEVSDSPAAVSISSAPRPGFIFGAPLDSAAKSPAASPLSALGEVIFGASSSAPCPVADPSTGLADVANPSGPGFIFSAASQASAISPGTPPPSPSLPMESDDRGDRKGDDDA